MADKELAVLRVEVDTLKDRAVEDREHYDKEIDDLWKDNSGMKKFIMATLGTGVLTLLVVVFNLITALMKTPAVQ